MESVLENRPLRRAISQHIEDPLAESLLSGDFKSGQKIMVTRKDEAQNLFFEAVDLPKEEPAEAEASGNDSEGDEAEPAATA